MLRSLLVVALLLPPPVQQAPPAQPPPMTSDDRVYTADQTSNTVTVIDPHANRVLGTIPLGSVRMDTGADTLGAMYNGQIDVHGLGFSRDGRYLDVIDVTTNAAHVVDTATNKVVHTIYLGRATHEGFFSPDGKELWVAERGQDTVAVVDWRNERVLDRIVSEDGPSKVVFSPDGKLAYVNHLRADAVDVIDVASRHIVTRVAVPAQAGGSSDEAISPDGRELWLGMPNNGRTTTVLNTGTHKVQAVLDTGPRTNHPNFATVGGVDYAYMTVGDLDQTLVYRRDPGGKPPTLVHRIQHRGHGPHGIWPSPDGSRMYVAMQYSDTVEVIDTAANKVVSSMPSGQSPMALVYVARSGPGSTTGLGRQGLDQRNEVLKVDVQNSDGSGTAQIRSLPGLDEIIVDVRGLRPNQRYTVYAARGHDTTVLLSATANAAGAMPEVPAYVQFFANRWDRVIVRPAPSGG
ncbi:MAG TPA: beta-propeller fold lactonase family protein [Dactylosporangium sp.]|nr:beta-propeller fold lactonase family protein [Dactylosporangium sp.]